MTIVSRSKLSLHFRSRVAGQGAAAHYSQVPCTLRSPANCPSLEIARALQHGQTYFSGSIPITSALTVNTDVASALFFLWPIPHQHRQIVSLAECEDDEKGARDFKKSEVFNRTTHVIVKTGKG